DINVSPSDLSQVFASLTTIDPDGVPNSGDEFQAGTLASNGGAVQTVLIEAGGDADNTGDNGALPPGLTDDARGDPRVANGTVVLGALEVQAPTPVISNPNAVIAVAGTGAIALDIAAPTDSDGS